MIFSKRFLFVHICPPLQIFLLYFKHFFFQRRTINFHYKNYFIWNGKHFPDLPRTHFKSIQTVKEIWNTNNIIMLNFTTNVIAFFNWDAFLEEDTSKNFPTTSLIIFTTNLRPFNGIPLLFLDIQVMSSDGNIRGKM